MNNQNNNIESNKIHFYRLYFNIDETLRSIRKQKKIYEIQQLVSFVLSSFWLCEK